MRGRNGYGQVVKVPRVRSVILAAITVSLAAGPLVALSAEGSGASLVRLMGDGRIEIWEMERFPRVGYTKIRQNSSPEVACQVHSSPLRLRLLN